VEAASRHFAARLEAASGDKIDLACRLALGRPPSDDERRALSAHLQTHGPASLARVIFNLNAFVYVD
jgi:hypothetical protein